MSSADRTSAPGRRRASRVGAAVALLALLAGTSACAGAADAGAAGAATGTVAPGIPADDTTRRIAQVEFERQCTVDAMSFVQEADITTDLDTRLAAAGFTHQQWKEWHDALAGSPELVGQFAEISTAGCAAG